jgi:hypothetical protein
MRRHNGNLLAPTFGALGLRCPMLRNCLGTFERGTAFLAERLFRGEVLRQHLDLWRQRALVEQEAFEALDELIALGD